MTELKVITAHNAEELEKEVNGFCCNQGYKIINCQVSVIQDNSPRFVYTAFIGKE